LPLHELRVIPADVSGSGLRLALNAAAAPALASSTLIHPDGADLVLGVLGASHVIRVQQFSEQVSCTPLPDDSALPASVRTAGYRLQSDTSTHDEAAFRRIAAGLRERCADRDGWLGGTFPGDDAALTALCAEPDGPGWRWQTWHLYPESDGGTVVHTASRWQP
jgi:hypothetical protein